MKRWLIILLFFITIICIAIGHAIYGYYTPPTERKAYIIPHHHDDTLRIAYIGDSWAAMHKEHRCLIAQLIKDRIHRPVKVSSFGIHGKTSKEIYENLFDNQNMRHFMMQGYDFCFISAGINDTYKKMSATYYRTSMYNIIHFMLTNHIHPIILDIPDYDIVKAYDRQHSYRKLLRRMSILITESRMDCKQEFRNTLTELVTDLKNNNQISILNYQEWNNEYHNDIKKYYLGDGMHLNKLGYAKLDSCIAKHIIQQTY